MRTILFTVSRLEFIGSGKFMVAGRNCQDELRRGDQLQLKGGCDGARIVVQVDEIVWFNQSVAAVESGHAAGLYFRNEFAPAFRLGAELRAELV